MTSPQEERPVDLEDVPGEEDINSADAADRLDQDPREQPNFTDDHARGEGVVTEDS